MDYSKYYNDKLEKGLEYQDFVLDTLHERLGLVISYYSSKKYQFEKGESKSGIEIKYDMRYKDTGNLYIEYAEKKPEKKYFVISGIERPDNTWLYVIGDHDTIYIFAKSWLQQLKNVKGLRHIQTDTSKGYLLPKDMAKKYAIKVLNLKGVQNESCC